MTHNFVNQPCMELWFSFYFYLPLPKRAAFFSTQGISSIGEPVTAKLTCLHNEIFHMSHLAIVLSHFLFQ